MSVSAWEMPASLASIGSAFAVVWWLYRRGRLASLGLSVEAQHRAEDWFGLPALSRAAIADPVLALARVLAAIDDRVIDAGVRATASIASVASRAFSWWGERGVDGVVWSVAGATLATARASRAADERGVDGSVEGLAGAVGVAGQRSRKLQSGLSHHYYVLVVGGLVGVFLAAALGR